MLIFHIWFLIYAADKFTILNKPLSVCINWNAHCISLFLLLKAINFWGCETTLSHQFHTCSCWGFILMPSEQSFTPRVIRTWTRMNTAWKFEFTPWNVYFMPHDCFLFPRFWWKFISPVFPWRVTFIEKIQGAV